VSRAEKPEPRFPAVDNEDALKRLPREKEELPAWALAMIDSMPRTTAAMLDLDYLQRAKSPVGEALSAKIRWTVGDALDCRYAKKTAVGDLRRIGVGADEISVLSANPKDYPESERAVLAFARKLTKAGHTVTDAEVAEIVKQFSIEKTVAIVHTVAFANFQDRINLALGIDLEPAGPLPPLDLHFNKKELAKIEAPDRLEWSKVQAEDGPGLGIKPDWHGYDEVDKCLTGQKARKTRIPLPDADYLNKLPQDVREASESKILWNRVTYPYAPDLTRAWFNCASSWRHEAKPDRVFTCSMFWIVTRSNECFY
jgi:alkylhydroperoxidase family enzyme